MFKGITVISFYYKANKRAWITTQITLDWIQDHFVKEACLYCNSMGLDWDYKILFVLANCFAHPDTHLLVNVFAVYLPPNCISKWIKVFYALWSSNTGQSLWEECYVHAVAVYELMSFKKNFNFKDAIWTIARAWDNVTSDTLKHGWYKLWPSLRFNDKENDREL